MLLIVSIRNTVYWHSTSQTLENIAKELKSKLLSSSLGKSEFLKPLLLADCRTCVTLLG